MKPCKIVIYSKLSFGGQKRFRFLFLLVLIANFYFLFLVCKIPNTSRVFRKIVCFGFPFDYK